MKRNIRFPKLSRLGKTVRNFLICLVLLAVVWGAYGYPLPTKEMNFRRMEDYYMIPRGELVFRSGDLFVDEGDGQAVAGCVLTRKRLGAWQYGFIDIWICPIEDKPSPVATADDGLLFLRVPEEAARAEVVMMPGQKETQTSVGEKVKGGVWRFCLEQAYPNLVSEYSQHHGVEGRPYILRLYDAQNSLLLEQEGVVPMAEHRDSLKWKTN